MSAPAVLEARALTRRYDGVAVVDGVDLTLHEGETVALLGPNGSGKTTLMGMLVDLITPTSGTVTGHARGVGWVPQGGGTYSRLSVRENLCLFAELLGLPSPAEAARAAADEVDLAPWLDHAQWQLSGGLRQRLNIAVGLLGNPAVIALDEPSTGVDLYQQQKLWSVLKQGPATGRRTIVYSTHSIEEAHFADRLVVLVAGRIAYEGPLDGLRAFDDARSFPNLSDPIARGLLAVWNQREGAGA